MAGAAAGNYVTAIYGSQAVFLVLSVVAVAMRLWARRVDRVGLAATDYTILIALATLVGICSQNLWGASIGVLGVDFAALRDDQMIVLKKLIFTSSMLNFSGLGMVKISVALFYRVLFFIKPTFTRVVNVYIGVTAIWTFIALLTTMLCIKPIQGIWLPIPKEPRFNVRLWLVVITAIDIVLDVTILCMPLFALGQLRLSLRRKIQAGGIFALGFLVCVGSALHLYYIIRLDNTNVLSSVEVNAGNFVTASLETAGSIITACLPTLAPLFRSKSRFSSPFRSARSDDAPGGGQNPFGNLSDQTTEVNRLSNSIIVHTSSSKDIEAQQSKKGCVVVERSFGSENYTPNDLWDSISR